MYTLRVENGENDMLNQTSVANVLNENYNGRRNGPPAWTEWAQIRKHFDQFCPRIKGTIILNWTSANSHSYCYRDAVYGETSSNNRVCVCVCVQIIWNGFSSNSHSTSNIIDFSSFFSSVWFSYSNLWRKWDTAT